MITRFTAYAHAMLRAGLTAGVLVGSICAYGQDDLDPELEPEAPAQVQPVFEISDDNFDQWVFGGGRNSTVARRRLDQLLTLQIENINRVCTLTPDQQNKLRLAGRGDIKRFYSLVDEKRRKFQLVKRDQNKINEIFQEIQPLQNMLNTGLYADGSFFAKSVRKTLTSDQTAAYDADVREKKMFRYKAKVDLAIATLDRSVGIRFEQRKQLAKLLMDETSPPKKFGQYDYYVIVLQASHIPEQKIKPIFDDQQWRLLNRQFQTARGLEPFLRNGGFLPDAPRAPDAQPAPASPPAGTD